MRFGEKTRNFLLYGIDRKIESKQIYRLDGAMLFVSVLAMFMAEAISAPSFIRVSLVLFYICFVVATFSKTDVTGEKVFWIYGVQGLGISVLLCWFGTALMLSTIGEEHHTPYIIVLLLVYAVAAIGIGFLIFLLIKKDKYAPSSGRIAAGGWSAACFAAFGISAAKMASARVPDTFGIRMAGLGFYLVSLLSLISVWNIVKYFVIKKYNIQPDH